MLKLARGRRVADTSHVAVHDCGARRNRGRVVVVAVLYTQLEHLAWTWASSSYSGRMRLLKGGRATGTTSLGGGSVRQ